MIGKCINGLVALAIVGIVSSCEKTSPTPTPPVEPTPASFSEVQDKGIIENPELDEASGMVYSNTNPGYIWALNDSSNPNKIFLVNGSNAKGVYNFTLSGVTNRDWESMSIFKESDGSSTLFVADTGDNLARYDSYMLYWFKEPTLDPAQPNRTVTGISKLQFTLSDGTKRDMEAILIDQKSKDIFIISKREDQKKLYKISADKLVNGNTTTAEFIADLDFSNPFSSNQNVKTYFYITDGSVSPDNSEILVRNYGEIYYWKRKTGETIPEALARQARVVPSFTKYSLNSNNLGEPQGEGVTFSSTADGYFTLSETADYSIPTNLYFFKRK